MAAAHVGRVGRPQSLETRAKMSASKRGVSKSPEQRARLAALRKGTTLSAEHRAKIAAALTGRPCSAETRAKIGAAHRGKPMSVEARANLAKGRGQPLSPEHRAKIGASLKGKKHPQRRPASPKTAETRAKLRRANVGKKLSVEHRAKLAAAKAGKIQPPEHVERRRQSLLGTTWTPEARARWSAKVKAAWAEGRGTGDLATKANHYTKLAQRLHRYLEDRCGIVGLQVEASFPPYRVDLYDPVTKTAFEADGSYWHARNEAQAAGRQARRDTVLVFRYGITVLHFTDEEIRALELKARKAAVA